MPQRPKNDFTVDDWAALYAVYRLQLVVAREGAAGLRNFIALVKASAPREDWK